MKKNGCTNHLFLHSCAPRKRVGAEGVEIKKTLVTGHLDKCELCVQEGRETEPQLTFETV